MRAGGRATPPPPPPATRTHIQLNKRGGLLPVERRFLIPGSGPDLRRQPRPHPPLERSRFLPSPEFDLWNPDNLFVLISPP